MLLEPLSPQVATRMGLPQTTRGFLITGVDPTGAAAAAGLQPGDLITRVDEIEVRALSDLDAALAKRRDRPALLLVIRDGSGLFVALKAGR
jgi:serine protease Do